MIDAKSARLIFEKVDQEKNQKIFESIESSLTEQITNNSQFGFNQLIFLKKDNFNIFERSTFPAFLKEKLESELGYIVELNPDEKIIIEW